jgi:hypothetical protein
MSLRTKYISTKSKECINNNRTLVSVGSDGAISFIHMPKPMQSILLYPDQVKALLQFIGPVCFCDEPTINKFGMDNSCAKCGKPVIFQTSKPKQTTEVKQP